MELLCLGFGSLFSYGMYTVFDDGYKLNAKKRNEYNNVRNLDFNTNSTFISGIYRLKNLNTSCVYRTIYSNIHRTEYIYNPYNTYECQTYERDYYMRKLLVSMYYNGSMKIRNQPRKKIILINKKKPKVRLCPFLNQCMIRLIWQILILIQEVQLVEQVLVQNQDKQKKVLRSKKSINSIIKACKYA